MTLDTLLYHKEIMGGNYLKPVEGGNPMTGETGWNHLAQRPMSLFIGAARDRRGNPILALNS